VLALDVDTGRVLWRTYLTPPPAPTPEESFTGVSAWGSSPAIDTRRGLAYVATGNNYSVPKSVSACVLAAQGQPNEAELTRACVFDAPGGRDNHFDSVLALDLKTGAIVWSRCTVPYDAWVLACLFGPGVCPDPVGPDYDFAQAPALFTVRTRHGRRELLGAGQKSGQYWAFDPDSGEVVWVTQVGPGGSAGGLQWGSAVDGRRVYTASANWEFKPHTFTTGLESGRTLTGGFWTALDAATGERLWEAAGAQPPAVPPAGGAPAGSIASNQGPVSVANGVLFAGALDAMGTMYALDAASGAVLWSFESGGSVGSGPAIADGELYWGSGFVSWAGTANDKLYAFALHGPR
jgi:polyvinyl alcohol dehydrogenase (cytochrome)